MCATVSMWNKTRQGYKCNCYWSRQMQYMRLPIAIKFSIGPRKNVCPPCPSTNYFALIGITFVGIRRKRWQYRRQTRQFVLYMIGSSTMTQGWKYSTRRKIKKVLISHGSFLFLYRPVLTVVIKIYLRFGNPRSFQNILHCLSHLPCNACGQCLHFSFDKDHAEDLSC